MPRYNHVRELPSGRFQGRYRDRDGETHAKTFDTAREAGAWVGEQQEALRQDTWINPQHGEELIKNWSPRWLDSRIDVRASTKARDESYVLNHVVTALGEKQLDELTQLDVRDFVAALHAKGLKPATVQKIYQLLSKIMSSAVDARLIKQSPCFNVPLPRIAREEMRHLAPAEIWHLADAMPERYRALVLIGCYGGLRTGEIAGLERRHFEDSVSPARLRVVQTLVEVRGKITINPP